MLIGQLLEVLIIFYLLCIHILCEGINIVV